MYMNSRKIKISACPKCGLDGLIENGICRVCKNAENHICSNHVDCIPADYMVKYPGCQDQYMCSECVILIHPEMEIVKL